MSVRSFAMVLALGLLVGVSIVPSAGSAHYPCLVSHERTKMVSRSLQQAIDRAAAGDTLLVKGTCFGASTIDKDLTVQGVSTKQFGVATLDGGNSADTVLAVSAVDRVTAAIDDLIVTHADAASSPTALWVARSASPARPSATTTDPASRASSRR